MSLPQQLMNARRLFILIILLTVTACQPDNGEVLPTRVVIAFPTDFNSEADSELSLTDSTVATANPGTVTRTPTLLPTLTHTPTPTSEPTLIPSPTITDTPTLDPAAPTRTPVPPSLTPSFTPPPVLDITPFATSTLGPLQIIQIPPADSGGLVAVPQPEVRGPINLPDAFYYGRSIDGRDLYARRIGTGTTVIMLVGGIHGGFESNTTDLVNQLITHFERAPSQVLPSVSLLLIPAANPDGLARGRTLAGRFNANGVDLNRNWGCGWEPNAFFQNQQVNPGIQPFSEPESAALAALINDIRPAIVLFYHSAANGIYAGSCGGDGRSATLAQVLGIATGYPFGTPFNAYPISGTAPSWVDSLNIASADVELSSADNAEFERNLNGVMALQCWVVGEGAAIFRECVN